MVDNIRAFLIKKYFGIKPNRHTATEFEEIFKEVGFRFVKGITPVPSLVRYCLVNNH